MKVIVTRTNHKGTVQVTKISFVHRHFTLYLDLSFDPILKLTIRLNLL